MTSEEPLPEMLPALGVTDAGVAEEGVTGVPAPLTTAGRLAVLRAHAEQVVPPLARAIGWLRWPTLLLLVVAAAAPLLLALLALTWQGWPRIAGVVAALLAAVPVVLLARSRAGTLRAVGNPSALVTELTDFADHVSGGLGVLDRLAVLAERGGGLRLLARLRALWDVVQLPSEVLDHLDSQTHLRWILPPRVGETWARLLLTVWTTIGCWVLLVALAGVSLTDRL